jgi:hypothetical protein
MVKKIIFYSLLFLILIFLQLYALPFFFIYALFILFWIGLGAKEIYLFLIVALALDLLSSFYFGFWFIFSITIFFSSGLILRSFLKQWTAFTFILVFMFWELVYGFFYLYLSGRGFSWLIILDFIWIFIFSIIIFILLDFSKVWLERQELITTAKGTEINF